MTELRIGFIPLTDAAVLIAAAERGFAQAEGLTITLEREASWATLRDKLVLGMLDAAHMLAPLAIATSLGIGPGPSVPLTAPFALNLNGNAITLSLKLWRALGASENARLDEIASRLGDHIRSLRQRAEPPLTFATVYPYSSHTFLIRAFLRLAGADPDTDVSLTVVPPPYTVEALRNEVVDGFCVGSPWNSVAVAAGLGRIVVIGPDLLPDAPEKVLTWPRGRIPGATAAALMRAMQAAGDWCAAPEHRGELASILADTRYVAIEREIILASLEGQLPLGPGGPVRSAPDYIRFGGTTHLAKPAHARWIYEHMVEARQIARPLGLDDAMAVYAGSDRV